MKGGSRLQSTLGLNLGSLGSKGFSIIEVLIVLAVTAGLFLSAVFMLSGKQRQTEFSTALREAQTQLQQTISEVSAGFYPTQENFDCAASISGPVITPGTTNAQGENSGCVFLGKVIQFGVSGTEPEEFATFPVAGLQRMGGVITGQEVQSLTDARPKVVAQSAFNTTAPDSSIQPRYLRAGLTTKWVRNADGGGDLGAVGFISSLAQYTGGKINSGSQVVNLMPISGTSVGMDHLAMANAINTNLAGSAVNPTNGVQICLVSAGTAQSGLVTIGGGGRQLSVKVSVKDNDSCS
jgi:prepilin-type N-terminal cleavage/methylation domain-containing protein